MATMKCTKCDWRVPNDETWPEKAEEHIEDTNHMVYMVDRKSQSTEHREEAGR